ncbi:double-strand break repair protein AddB [Erythrobacteraceae bacterium CFH 75059]|uniref:double-strand break repair protein AddB n=1 Tax=Qipengyuania thermophila TaxID=2509361 RepID=UPI001022759F|nr:double-strand break repair protein AddB [Qipengyuania thermophila]TCD05055.1 double-strand break repair protein AddB [Erythrobacteraceae bacterium CFH 75059]
MADRRSPAVFSIAAHRGFADALVAGLVPRYADPHLGLARLTLLLPNQRARRTLTEAFVRHSEGAGRTALLLPRMAVVGDLDLDETLGVLLDPLAGGTIPPAVPPMQRWLALGTLLEDELGPGTLPAPARMRLARQIGETMDRLLVEEVAPEDLTGEPVLALLGDLAGHWQQSLRTFARVQLRWLDRLRRDGLVDAAQRRNLLFDRMARALRTDEFAGPIVAAGVTSPAPALARMLRAVADLPDSAVVLPDLDLFLTDDAWDELGAAGRPAADGAEAFTRDDAVTHPQYHLKLLLNRMGVARGEVRPWHRRGQSAAPPDRSHAISALFLPPQASRGWVDLPAERRRMAGVKVAELATPEEEAQAIALLVREALETPTTRVAIVTPSRSIARRVVQHLRRWNIEADDSAGRPLSQTAAGRLLLLLAQVAAEEAAPVALLGLLKHPLVNGGGERIAWLESVRELDLVLRGPRLAPGLAALRVRIGAIKKDEVRARLLAWWDTVEPALAQLFACLPDGLAPMDAQLACMVSVAQQLCGAAVWAREDGRALAAFLEELQQHASREGTQVAPRELAAVLQDAMACVAVRPPPIGHSRVAIYGLIEARMTRADLMIAAGLNEGTWPGRAAVDALLAPAVLRALAVPGAEYRIGLAAHDFAAALGAPRVVLTRSRRDSSGPAVPSRFLLRLKALLGKQIDDHMHGELVSWVAAIDSAGGARAAAARPQPRPARHQRDVSLAVTALDRLRSDPYQFYASAILRLKKLDEVDAPASPAWQGQIAHQILEQWHKARRVGTDTTLESITAAALAEMGAHPVTRALWRPRLLAALRWVEREVTGNCEREPVCWEVDGSMRVEGVRVHGRADRIDRFADGTLAIVDYKTGRPPATKAVEQGFALQLGTLGLIARAGGFDGVRGEPVAFEYWSLARNSNSPTGFGARETPLRVAGKRSGVDPDAFLPRTEAFLLDAIRRWITGDEPFTARLNPDYPGFADYDHLMRLDEWFALSGSPEPAEVEGG